MSALAFVSRPADHDSDDLDLVAGVRAGDDRAFEALYLRYRGRITAYVRGMVHDHGRTEDITQEVFMSALRRMRGTDAPIAFKPWIYEIAKNACIDAWRRSRNANEVSFDAQDGLGPDDHGRLADPGVTPDSAIDTKDSIDNLCGAFGGLSQTHHDILVMREFEGLSYREIGERLGMSRPGVESTLFRARRRLSEEYEELVSGARCVRVQRIIDGLDGRATGAREQRRMARHLSHCQPCRRHACLAGVNLDTALRPAAAAAKIAAWCPLPLSLRRRWGGEEAGQFIAQSHHGPISQWSASLAATFDPATVSGWSKAIATAATVTVVGVGAGAAIRQHHGGGGRVATPPAAAVQSPSHGGAGASGARTGHATAAKRRRGAAGAAGAEASAPAPATGSPAVTLPRVPAGSAPAVTQDAPRPAAAGEHATSRPGTAHVPVVSAPPADQPISAALNAAPAVPAPEALDHVLGGLDAGAPATPAVASGTGSTPAGSPPAAGAPASVQAATTDPNGTVSATVSGTPSPTISGRIAP